MRVVHYARSEGRLLDGWAEPLCGDWGSMDTDWTDSTSGVTCEVCRGALRRGVEKRLVPPREATQLGQAR